MCMPTVKSTVHSCVLSVLLWTFVVCIISSSHRVCSQRPSPLIASLPVPQQMMSKPFCFSTWACQLPIWLLVKVLFLQISEGNPNANPNPNSWPYNLWKSWTDFLYQKLHFTAIARCFVNRQKTKKQFCIRPHWLETLSLASRIICHKPTRGQLWSSAKKQVRWQYFFQLFNCLCHCCFTWGHYNSQKNGFCNSCCSNIYAGVFNLSRLAVAS